eukprot:gb/GEZN01001872.1/.p1 GENE.gb/GEZN01001872.1/~~gb/GEZN01001872.1/.p1  ORF type:complete len:875 (+),score=80.42 gb/GEZN01001872.1/:73-2697(+)
MTEIQRLLPEGGERHPTYQTAEQELTTEGKGRADDSEGDERELYVGSTPPRPLTNPAWGSTGVRHRWSRQDSSLEAELRRVATPLKVSPDRTSVPSLPIPFSSEAATPNRLVRALKQVPSLLIAVTLNLMLCVPFGLAFFPARWTAFPVSRSVGIQMWLFSTIVCQVVMSLQSSFPFAAGMMMVENIPFMHALAHEAIQQMGEGKDTLATVMFEFALSSFACGVTFYCLGRFKLGTVVSFFPRHVIVGCIGGVGVFVTQAGLESATGVPFYWTQENISVFLTHLPVVKLWALSLSLSFLLRLILYLRHLPLLPPVYFVAIPPFFYLSLYLFGVPISVAREEGWFFERAESSSPTLIFELIDFHLVNWGVVFRSFPTIVALTIFSLMHVPINVPSLSLSTGCEVDMNEELKAHGVSNLIVAMFGGTQNYLCYSNSLLYFRCNGGGKISGIILAALTSIFYVVGPALLAYIPRPMAGCLLLHVGIDLSREAIVDSYSTFDPIEYFTVLLITLAMTAYGMTAGLGVGVVCAAFAFTAQTGIHINPIRGVMPATTLRSSRLRGVAAQQVLARDSHQILVVQLHGNLFFGNAPKMTQTVLELLQTRTVSVLLLDFTLVVAIDSSAAETIAKLYKQTQSQGVKLCFARGSAAGFPCAVGLSDRLLSISGPPTLSAKPRVNNETPGIAYEVLAATLGDSPDIGVTDDLDSALQWAEDVLINQTMPGYDSSQPAPTSPSQAISLLCPLADLHEINSLLDAFEPAQVKKDTVLWHQGDNSECCVFFLHGKLVSCLEEEAGTTEPVAENMLIGEYGLLNEKKRYSTIKALEDSECLILCKPKLQELERKSPKLVLLLSRICMAYLGKRTMHVANRIWESRCLPV